MNIMNTKTENRQHSNYIKIMQLYWKKQYSKLREIKTLSLNDKFLQVKKKKLTMYIGHTRLYVQNGLMTKK